MPAIVALLVKDDAVRSAIAFVLEIEGFAVRSYDNAQLLLADRSLPPDFVVIDMDPNGMDSVAYLGLLRQAGMRKHAIILATNPSRAMKRRIAEAGAMLIEKPLLSDVLTASIRLLASHDGSAPE